MIAGYMGRILEIDLAAKTSRTITPSEEDLTLYIGGKGLATKLLYDWAEPGIDPLSEHNPLIFTVGPLTGHKLPQSNRFVVAAKSPLTGAIGTSNCGGNFAAGIKGAGYDAIILKNKMNDWTWIDIDENNVKFNSADNLLGKGTYETQEILPKDSYKAVIGPAGENLVLYAGVVSQERIAGRTGMGAVMGSKKVKAITIRGKQKPTAQHEEKLQEYTKWFNGYRKRHKMLGEILPKYGTAGNVIPVQGTGTMPTRNYSRGTFDDFMKISGAYLTDNDLVKQTGCLYCPVRCGRVVNVDGVNRKGPEYETLALMGSNLEINNIPDISRLNYLCDDYGMDTISCGGTLAFAMELTEKGMLKSDLKFGHTENLPDVLKDIAFRKGLGDDLANGTRKMADKYGGHDFAANVKGLELPGYDPRGTFAQGLEYLTTNRGGCHIQGGSMFMETLGPLTIDPISTKLKPELSIMMQNQSDYISSLILCMFTSYGMLPSVVWNMKANGTPMRMTTKIFQNAGPVIRFAVRHYPGGTPIFWWEKWLTYITGNKTTMGDVQRIGARIVNLGRMFNLREGIGSDQDMFPARILNQPLMSSRGIKYPVKELLSKYYKIRGWDIDGVPTAKTLRKLDIAV